MKFPFKKYYLTTEQVYQEIQSFINKQGGAWDWDDFLYAPIKDPYLKEIQQKCLNLPDKYPPGDPKEYCNEEGIKILKQLLSDLKSKIESEQQNS